MKVNPNRQQEVCITRLLPDSSQAVFLYLGVQGGLFLRPLEFIKLTGTAKRNLAMFRDFRDGFFHDFINPQWPNIDAAITNQRKLLASCPHVKELFCAGTSSGAYAAILFGHYLGADHVHAFAPKTRLDADQSRAEISIPEKHRDLSLLLHEWNGKTRYSIYYSEGHEKDSAAAAWISDCPGVELYPQPGKHHNVMKDVDSEKLLVNLFPPKA